MKPKPKPRTFQQPLMGSMRLDLALDMGHELVKLAGVIPWDRLAEEFDPLYCADNGRPALPIRLMAGLHFLKHMEGLSDEAVVDRWVENPYWQFFCGEEFFQHSLPIDPSQMTRWRKRVGETGVEKLLQATIAAGKTTKTITESSFEKVIVDTTVQPKAVQFPTDARLYRRIHAAMLRIAEKEGLTPRQSYRKLMTQAFSKHGGYAKAKPPAIGRLHVLLFALLTELEPLKRARKVLRSVKAMAGRVLRDVQRKLSPEALKAHQEAFELSNRILAQTRTSKGKVYSLYAPEVECIAKGKAHRPYEFGVKTSLATTHKEGFVVGIRACPGNPYDGHTLAEQLNQVERLTGEVPKLTFVDKGYKGHGVAETRSRVLISGTRRLPYRLKRQLRRRSAIEPEIGHMKSDGLLGRNFLKGTQGDAINAILCGAGHNLRKIMARIRALLCLLTSEARRALKTLLVPIEVPTHLSSTFNAA